MNPKTENKPTAFLFVIACIALWSFVPVVSKLGQQKLDHYQFLFWSSLLSFAVLSATMMVAGKAQSLKNYDIKQLVTALGLGFLGAFLYYLLLYFGYANVSGLEVLVIQYTWPIFIVVFSVLFLKEKISGRNIIALFLGFSGVVIVLTKGDFSSLHLSNFTTDLIVLLAAAVFGLFSVLSKKANFEPFSAAALFFLSATFFSFLAMLLFSSFATPATNELIPIFANGVFVNGFSYILWLLGLSYAKASFVAPLVFLTPILAAIWVVVFFHEAFLPAYFTGLALVVCAGLVAK